MLRKDVQDESDPVDDVGFGNEETGAGAFCLVDESISERIARNIHIVGEPRLFANSGDISCDRLRAEFQIESDFFYGPAPGDLHEYLELRLDSATCGFEEADLRCHEPGRQPIENPQL